MLKKLRELPLLPLGSVLVLVAIIPFLLQQGNDVFANNTDAGRPSISITASSASPGTTITVTGFNYPAHRAVQVYFQNRANGVVIAIADDSGLFTTPLTLPDKYTRGTVYYVYAVSGHKSARVAFTFAQSSTTTTDARVAPFVIATSTHNASSITIMMDGGNFRPKASMRFYLCDAKKKASFCNTVLGKITVSDQGTFENVFTPLFSIEPGKAYYLSFVDEASGSSLQVRVLLHLLPHYNKRGQLIS